MAIVGVLLCVCLCVCGGVVNSDVMRSVCYNVGHGDLSTDTVLAESKGVQVVCKGLKHQIHQIFNRQSLKKKRKYFMIWHGSLCNCCLQRTDHSLLSLKIKA